ncbi:hypothetical protein [Streptomyces anulatus]|uniref:hypothetical protein n=1 Tax=Streptomyces anulatus TaxID=1892 RepID=UPI00344341DA
MRWVRLNALPEGMVAYCRAALEAYAAGTRIAVHFQQPGDAIAYDPGADRLRHLPDVTGPDANGPGGAVVEFAERAVGRIAEWTDTSWARASSQVWRAANPHGGAWYVKVHQNFRFHDREVRALRTWVPALGAAAPRLVAADPELRAVVLSEVTGRPLHGAALPDWQEREVFRRIGELARQVHRSAPPRAAPTARARRSARPTGTWPPHDRCWPPGTRHSSATSCAGRRTCPRWNGWRPTATSGTFIRQVDCRV